MTVVVKNTDTNVDARRGHRRRRPLSRDGAAAGALRSHRHARGFPGHADHARSRSRSARPRRSTSRMRAGRRDRDGHCLRRSAAHRHQRTDVSNVVGETAIANLPINGRRWENFVLLGPGGHQRRQLRPRQLPRHLRPLQQQHRRRRGQQPGVLLGGARPHPDVVFDQPGRDQGVPGRHQQLLGGVRPRGRRHRQRGHQVGHEQLSRRGRSTSCATTSSSRRIRSSPRSSPDERRQQFGVSAGGPIQRRQGVLLRQLRPAAARLPVLRAAGTDHVPHAAPARSPGCASTVGVLQRPERASTRARATTRSCSARSTTRVSSKQQPDAAVQHAPLGFAERRSDPAGHFGVSPSANGKDIVKTDFALATLNSVLSQRG